MQRDIWIDWLRVAAIFMVIIVHSTEPFYLGGEGSLVLSETDGMWVALFDSLARTCVPLFVIASSYLQLPLRHTTAAFFRKRAVRILIPFAVWTVVYALVWGEPVQNFKDLLLNFNYAAGHLWFVYMLVGVYLLIPILTPWAAKVSRKELLFYLAVCLITSFIPFIREMCSDESAAVIYGPSGIPNFAKFPLWGECSWNSYGLFYYFSGFIGYILLGLYIRRFVGDMTWPKTILAGVIPWLAGFAISFFGFVGRVNASAQGQFPFEGPVGIAAMWETPLFYDSFGVVLMAFGLIILFRKIGSSGRVYSVLTLPLAKDSYGVYLCHMLLLVPVSGWMRQTFGLAPDGVLGIWSTPVEILCTAVVTFVGASVFCEIVRHIPRVGKYIVG